VSEISDRLLLAQLRAAEQAARWEPWKALAALLGAAAVFGGLVIALASVWHPRPQEITVRFEQPLHVELKQ